MSDRAKGGFGDNPQNINRKGRPPKEQALTDVLRSKLDKDAVAEKLIEMAMEKGDISALKYIYDRVDGRPTETIHQTSKIIPEYIGFEDKDDTEDTDTD